MQCVKSGLRVFFSLLLLFFWFGVLAYFHAYVFYDNQLKVSTHNEIFANSMHSTKGFTRWLLRAACQMIKDKMSLLDGICGYGSGDIMRKDDYIIVMTYNYRVPFLGKQEYLSSASIFYYLSHTWSALHKVKTDKRNALTLLFLFLDVNKSNQPQGLGSYQCIKKCVVSNFFHLHT